MGTFHEDPEWGASMAITLKHTIVHARAPRQTT